MRYGTVMGGRSSIVPATGVVVLHLKRREVVGSSVVGEVASILGQDDYICSTCSDYVISLAKVVEVRGRLEQGTLRDSARVGSPHQLRSSDSLWRPTARRGGSAYRRDDSFGNNKVMDCEPHGGGCSDPVCSRLPFGLALGSKKLG